MYRYTYESDNTLKVMTCLFAYIGVSSFFVSFEMQVTAIKTQVNVRLSWTLTRNDLQS